MSKINPGTEVARRLGASPADVREYVNAIDRVLRPHGFKIRRDEVRGMIAEHLLLENVDPTALAERVVRACISEAESAERFSRLVTVVSAGLPTLGRQSR